MTQFDTDLVSIDFHDSYHSAVPPLYLTSTYHRASIDDDGGYLYTRMHNPTRTILDDHLSKLFKGAHRAYAVSSGMSAIDLVVKLLKPGDEIIAGNDLYGGTNKLLQYYHNQLNIHVHQVNTNKLSEIEAAITPQTKLVFVETPTNPLLKVSDIEAIAKLTKEKAPQALFAVDNTMLSPLNANPLAVGADIWVESATKYLSGHHDLLAGVIAVKDPKISKTIDDHIGLFGYGLNPMDSWLLLKGIKTLEIRYEKQQANTIAITEYLETLKPQFKGPKLEIFYPGLKSHPGYDIHAKYAKGPGAVFSFRTGDLDTSKRILNELKIFKIGVSLGATNSLISLPGQMSHASIDAKTREERGLHADIVRVCVGIENQQDLLDDFKQAFHNSKAI